MDAFMFKIILMPPPCFTHGIFHLGRSPFLGMEGITSALGQEWLWAGETAAPLRGRAVSYSSANRDVGTPWYCSHRGEQLFPDSWLRRFTHPLCFSCSQALNQAFIERVIFRALALVCCRENKPHEGGKHPHRRRLGQEPPDPR